MSNSENSRKLGVVFTTPRLILRAVCEADLPELYGKIFSVPDVMRYVFNGVTLSDVESESFVREHFNSGNDKTGLSVLVEKASEQVVGFAGLKSCTALEAHDFEIGFVLAREAWGKGFAREIGQAQLAFGFQELGCRRLLALVSPENISSVRILEKLGMSHVRDLAVEGRGSRQVYCIEAEQWNGRALLNNGHG